jgi:mannose-6-phosphate isomerase-like protein (cupin superfamily)
MLDNAPLRMPGATLTTRLKVYDTAGPDGQFGGTPHLHLCCTEMYFVIGGSGWVEIIDPSGFSRVELPLHAAYIFSPGTIHRLINPSRDLELFIIMQNSGLPERGDNVVTFNREIMQAQERYAEAMKVATPEDGYRRRDQGVEGFLELKEAFKQGDKEGAAALNKFYDLAARRTTARQEEWRKVVTEGALAEAQRSLQILDELARGETGYLTGTQQHLILPQPYSTVGFCGRLNRYFDPATLSLEGKITK